MRLHLKLSQQLVMTPQLQQAIKLLQLSRMELVDLVHEEMLENPILEDDIESQSEQSRERDLAGGDDSAERMVETAGNTETPMLDGKTDGEVKADSSAVNEIDWENYLDNYTMGPPMPSYRPDSDELPGLEAT
ncbi:MAG TPA: RNA polymerase sigma-54 factor, partial [Kofleriaceae bacterium]|nr:RNA polymerase sigma-54 factor [Kofleriaceae bacterium]